MKVREKLREEYKLEKSVGKKKRNEPAIRLICKDCQEYKEIREIYCNFQQYIF